MVSGFRDVEPCLLFPSPKKPGVNSFLRFPLEFAAEWVYSISRLQKFNNNCTVFSIIKDKIGFEWDIWKKRYWVRSRINRKNIQFLSAARSPEKNFQRRCVIKKIHLLIFAWGLVSALACAFFSEFMFIAVLSIPGVLVSIIWFLLRNRVFKKYGLLIICIFFISIGYSYLYSLRIAEYFQIWEFIHVCGPAGLSGFGLLLLWNSNEYRKRIHDKNVMNMLLSMTITAGSVLFLLGVWWIVIIIFYYSRIFYWPLFSGFALLSAACCLSGGAFSFLLARNKGKILPLLLSDDKPRLYPVFRFILLEKGSGAALCCLSLVCIVYQTLLFPLAGFWKQAAVLGLVPVKSEKRSSNIIFQ